MKTDDAKSGTSSQWRFRFGIEQLADADAAFLDKTSKSDSRTTFEDTSKNVRYKGLLTNRSSDRYGIPIQTGNVAMAVWVVRAGHLQDEFFEGGVTSIGYGITQDLTVAQTREQVRELVRLDHPGETNKRIGQITGQAWSFKNLVALGDLIVTPRPPIIAVGRMSGEYAYRADHPDCKHTRTIEWINREVPTAFLFEDLRRSLTSDTTVFQPRAKDAEARLLHMVSESPPRHDPGPSEHLAGDNGEDDELPDIDEPPVNLSEDAGLRIRNYISEHFLGHRFTGLVSEVLRAQGYTVDVAPPGPDGGVDIVAGSGPMGFDSPRICVQVKSGAQSANVKVLRELKGIIKDFGADYGLLISWGGFTGDAKSEARKSTYFNVRLWDSESFLAALFENYDRLPSGLRAELPLKQIWILEDPSL